ncbi:MULTISPECIES: ABC transporter substrate-binding protein [unclassified Rhizobium]|jgi:peptide/nickel transport system substrate-binding protein|uniref:ABC transporter substrate-binding protein n=1 Tax=unclassified Rhizobium TaxID=2613769 RepID=UPI000DC461B0|nr:MULTISPECIES: ABC transporter substrate-binding protein [unclassified Rhizobium]MBB3383290.1 peptide/nickel transport system substrate-binding protein [Rhizobium sp. BK098]MBB3424119.1 peptide/nickel transport system substrate-binding protein [Rhizobium sp. BK312]MBB3615405.1 peptide/nickel transport system substrate-binding protein [Rhizobium sp. BK609]MBB3681065.1 peptide/nickel transport system substrate-binding protein [Rhizobium sp. BK612]
MNDKIMNWTASDDAMVENAIRRGATRRELLTMLLAGGVAMSAGGLVLGRASNAVAATPKSGGNLKAAGWSSSTADTLDPAKASLSTDYVRCCSLYNRLTFIDKAGVTQMELAESIESKDAKTWTVKLRKGVTFHDGKELTADDVVFSLKRHLDPGVGSKVAKIAAQMTGFKAVDKSTVEIALADPNADLPTILALHHFMIVANGTTDFSKGNGTGAFVLETFDPGNRSVVVKNKNYWKSGQPYLESFEFFAISDDNARVNALLSGDIHYAASINPRAMKLIDGQSGFTLSKTTSGNYTNLNMRLDMTPGNKKDFIDGMKSLVNREQIVKSALRGLGEVANDQPVSPANIYHNNDLKPKAFDPDKAKFHFQKAGVLGQSIPVIASDAATSSIDMAMIIQAAGANIGMKLDVQRVPSDGYWDNYWLKAPIHFGNINPRPTPDILFSLLYASNAPWNESQYKSEKFDKMLIEARGLLDQAKRKQIYAEMQVMVAEEAGTIIPAYISNVDALSGKVHGLEANPLGGMMGYAMAEYLWLDA